MEGKEFKQESSIVVSSRVSMIDLANLDRYWHSEEVPIRSMSALVSASLALLVDVLRHNEALREEIKTVHDAHRWLISRGLYQPSLTKRNRQKISTALKFETLREEGIDPKSYVPEQYNTIHRGSSVNEVHGELEDWQIRRLEIQREMHEKRKAERKQAEELARSRAKKAIESNEFIVRSEPKQGLREGMSDEELAEYNAKREKEILERENQDISIEDIQTIKE